MRKALRKMDQAISGAMFSGDLECIISLLRNFRDELPGHVATDTDEQHVRDYLTACHQDGSLVYVFAYSGEQNETGIDLKKVGLALGVISDDWMRPAKICVEISFFLLPQYRGHSGLAQRLYGEFEQAAKQAGVVQMAMFNQHPGYENAAARFYRAQGFNPVGQAFQKELC